MTIKVIECGICHGLHCEDKPCHYWGSYFAMTFNGRKIYVDVATKRLIGSGVHGATKVIDHVASRMGA